MQQLRYFTYFTLSSVTRTVYLHSLGFDERFYHILKLSNFFFTFQRFSTFLLFFFFNVFCIYS